MLETNMGDIGAYPQLNVVNYSRILNRASISNQWFLNSGVRKKKIHWINKRVNADTFSVKREKKILVRCIHSHTWWSMTNDLPQQNPPIEPIAFSKLAHIISTSSTCKQISIRTCMAEWSRAWSRTNLEPNFQGATDRVVQKLAQFSHQS